jgi:ankyrin repeat protein
VEDPFTVDLIAALSSFHGTHDKTRTLKEVQRLILSRRVHLDTQDKNGLTALMMACSHAPYAIPLLTGADTRLVDRNGWNALMHAARQDNDVVHILVSQFPDIDPNMQDNDGRTALMQICTSLRGQVIHSLARIPGTDPNIVALDGQSVSMFFDRVTTPGPHLTQSLVELLMEIVQIPDLRTGLDKHGHNLIIRAIRMLVVPVVDSEFIRRVLKMPGVNINHRDEKGNSALTMAVDGGSYRLSRFSPTVAAFVQIWSTTMEGLRS